jgi:RNA-binding protein NOB1
MFSRSQDLAENIFTCSEVLDEITNNAQYKRLAVLPYSLQVKQPDPEALKVVSDFAKKTGDFATLSLTDLTVLALAYQLEKEKCGTDHLRKEPIVAQTVFSAQKPPELKEQCIAGFYNPNSKKDASTGEQGESSDEFEEIDEEEKETQDASQEESGNETDESDSKEDISEGVNDEELIKKFGTLGFNTIPNEQADEILQPVKENEDEDSEDSEDDEEDSDDGGGWITPGNISNVKKNFGGEVLEDQEAEVACVTTDFAMQNVLKQMGLKVTALDGRLIKHMRTFILRCYTCYKTTTDPTKIFCPKCGHKTLKRVGVSVNEKGEQLIHINARRQITAKYKNQPLPLPKGGKHACNPILFEDQPLPQQRLSKKATIKTDALDENYTSTTGYSPFVMRDLDSRSSKLRNTANIKQWMNNNDYDNHRRGYKKNKK